MWLENNACHRGLFCLSYLILVILSLSGCSYFGERGAVLTEPIDELSTPDAVPKAEYRSKYGNPKSYVVMGKRYHVLDSNNGFEQQGIASWYGDKFHGRRTSSGEIYNMHAMTAAHKTLILPAYVEVTNLNNGKKIVVKVNDRGPFHAGRIIDLSYVAAKKLDFLSAGTAPVKIRIVKAGSSPIISAANEKEKVMAPVVEGTSWPVRQPVNAVDSASAVDGESFFIQVGSFSTLSNAQALLERIEFIGKDLVKISDVIVNNKKFYRVRIGPLSYMKQADFIVRQLMQIDEYIHHIIVN